MGDMVDRQDMCGRGLAAQLECRLKCRTAKLRRPYLTFSIQIISFDNRIT